MRTEEARAPEGYQLITDMSRSMGNRMPYRALLEAVLRNKVKAVRVGRSWYIEKASGERFAHIRQRALEALAELTALSA